jgi:hypothetical protein
VQLHDLISALEILSRYGNYNKFKEEANIKRVSVNIHPKSLNFIKKFVLYNKMHEYHFCSTIVHLRMDSGDPNDCDFEKS